MDKIIGGLFDAYCYLNIISVIPITNAALIHCKGQHS